MSDGTNAVRDRRSLRELLDRHWDEQGACRSCAWHACVYEHDPEWADWNEAAGCFEFACRRNDCPGDDGDCRGVRVYVPEGEIAAALAEDEKGLL